MTLQIIDTIWIMNLSILELIERTQTIFGNHNRQIITGCDLTAAHADAHWIDRPIPVRRWKEFIGRILVKSRYTLYLRSTLLTGCVHLMGSSHAIDRVILYDGCLVIVYTHEVNLCGRFFQDFGIARLHLWCDSLTLQICDCCTRISAICIHVHPVVIPQIIIVRFRHRIFRMTIICVGW